MQSRETIASEVRALMARRQTTQTELAKSIGMSQAALSARLRGITPFTIDELERVVRHLDGNLLTLLTQAMAGAA